MLYKGLKGAASIPTNDLVPPIRRTRNHHSLAFQIPMAGTDIYESSAASIPTNDLVPPIRRTRNHHSLAFQIPMAGTDIYESSFFPQTIRDWNVLTDSLISASECSVDSVTKFTSLVRARD